MNQKCRSCGQLYSDGKSQYGSGNFSDYLASQPPTPARYCCYCGEDISKPCPHCYGQGSTHPINIGLCPSCSSPQRFCASCGGTGITYVIHTCRPKVKRPTHCDKCGVLSFNKCSLCEGAGSLLICPACNGSGGDDLGHYCF